MMKKNKNVVTNRLSCLIIITVLFFIGCGEKAKIENSKAEKEKNVKIGAILPLTGGGAFIGKSIQEGLLLAKEQYGENLELIIEDSQGIPKNALSIYKLLKTQKAVKIFIPVFSGVTNSLIPLSKSSDELLFATCVSSGNITQKNPNLFRLFVNANTDARKMAQYAVSQLEFKNFFIVYVNDDFGIDYSNTFIEEIGRRNANIIGKDTFDRNEIDFRNILLKMKKQSKNIDAVYLLGYEENMSIFLKQYVELKVLIPILSIATINQPNIKNAIREFFVDLPPIYFTDTLLYKDVEENQLRKDFMDKFTEKFNKKPNYFSAFAYDLLNIIIKSALNSDDIKKFMLKNTFYGVMGKIEFDASGDAQFPMVIEKME
jgi:branched-chain amino acid transport system substrate-binding protein